MPASLPAADDTPPETHTYRIAWVVDVELEEPAAVTSAMLNVPMNALLERLRNFNLVGEVTAVRFDVDGVPRLIFSDPY